MRSRCSIARLVTTSLLLAGLLACRAEPSVFEAEYHVFGTQVSVSLAMEDEALANRAFTDLQQLFQGLHHQLHAWEPSELTRLNSAIALGQPFSTSDELRTLIQASQALETRTGGRFNAAVGALVSAWGFHTSDYPVVTPAPEKAFLRRWSTSVPSSMSLHADGNPVRSEDVRVQLDFGGLAKGYAVDRAVALLQSLGIEDAMINAGGDLRAVGQRHDRPWRIAVMHPVSHELMTVIEGDGNTAVFTSGGQYRYRETGPGMPRWPHILDPKSGYPADGSAAVTVVAEDGMTADAWATALFVELLPGDRQQAGLQRVIQVRTDGEVVDFSPVSRVGEDVPVP